ncbi:UNVERIFIED_CONTAM: hypothetical protein HDU68_008801 [Siphonaria sp. JEL0065]|nr:hypothetical protein HDU68_008801 [Siphonaria sp. JEL0065]
MKFIATALLALQLSATISAAAVPAAPAANHIANPDDKPVDYSFDYNIGLGKRNVDKRTKLMRPGDTDIKYPAVGFDEDEFLGEDNDDKINGKRGMDKRTKLNKVGDTSKYPDVDIKSGGRRKRHDGETHDESSVHH